MEPRRGETTKAETPWLKDVLNRIDLIKALLKQGDTLSMSDFAELLAIRA